MSGATVSIFLAAGVAGVAIATLLTPHFPAPGIFIAILAAVTIALQLLRPNMTPEEKAAWIALILVVVSLEIASIYRERRKQDAAYRKDSNERTAQFRSLIDHITERSNTSSAAIIAVLNLRAKTSEKTITATATIHNPWNDAATLSSEILQFLVRRQSGEPPLPKSETWDQDTQRMITYLRETVGQYDVNFSNRVAQVREDLAKQNVTDAEFDMYRQNVVNPLQIRMLAQKLGEMSARRP